MRGIAGTAISVMQFNDVMRIHTSHVCIQYVGEHDLLAFCIPWLLYTLLLHHVCVCVCVCVCVSVCVCL